MKHPPRYSFLFLYVGAMDESSRLSR